jgi:hypothetical protein
MRIFNVYDWELFLLTIVANDLCCLYQPSRSSQMAHRIARNPAARKLKRFQITAEALPGAIFFSLGDLRGGCHDTLTERRAIDEYRRDGVEEALFETMRGLGWEYADIAAEARGVVLRRDTAAGALKKASELAEDGCWDIAITSPEGRRYISSEFDQLPADGWAA